MSSSRQWSAESRSADHVDLRASAMGLDPRGRMVLLAGRKGWALIDLLASSEDGVHEELSLGERIINAMSGRTNAQAFPDVSHRLGPPSTEEATKVAFGVGSTAAVASGDHVDLAEVGAAGVRRAGMFRLHSR